MAEFDHKTVVITGGAGGIGLAIRRAFEREGAQTEVIDLLPGDHFVGDVSDPDTLLAFAEEVKSRHRFVDVLINNAPPAMKGIGFCSYEEFMQALAVGVGAPFYLASLFQEVFAPGASIINISSTRERMSQAHTESYSAAKGGIGALTRALSVSLGPKVRVNAISPGWIDTGWRVYEGADALQQSAGRVGNPDDIASLALYLASGRAGFITGANITVDGGMSVRMIYHGDEGWSYSPPDRPGGDGA